MSAAMFLNSAGRDDHLRSHRGAIVMNAKVRHPSATWTHFACIIVLTLVLLPVIQAETALAAGGVENRSDYKILQATAPDLSADPNTETARCEKANDTSCLVAVWENQFKHKPYDDNVRGQLQAALLVNCFANLQTGNLSLVRAALTRAKEVTPTSNAYAYLDSALAAYDSLIYSANMESKTSFNPASDTGFEAQYVDIQSILGGQTSALALTEKSPGYSEGYSIFPYLSIPKNLAYRVLIFPTSVNGTVHIEFGRQSDNSYFALVLDWSSGSSVQASIAHYTPASGLQNISNTQYLTAVPNQWHTVEVRITGNSVQTCVDYQRAVQQDVFDYLPGKLGFGVGLGQYNTGMTFSAAFDDLVVYSLKP